MIEFQVMVFNGVMELQVTVDKMMELQVMVSNG